MSILNDSLMSPKQGGGVMPTGRSYKSTTREWLQHMTTPPFTADKAEDLYHLMMEQFENINEDVNTLIQKLNELKSPERYTVNSQIEQIAFKELGNSVVLNAMIEQVQLNEQDKEQTLLQGVISDLIRRMQ
jgi:hypothetical protein